VRVHVGSSAAKPFYFRVPGSGGAYYVTTLHHCNCLAYFNQVTVHKTHLMCKVSQRREARREDTDAASWQLDKTGGLTTAWNLLLTIFFDFFFVRLCSASNCSAVGGCTWQNGSEYTC